MGSTAQPPPRPAKIIPNVDATDPGELTRAEYARLSIATMQFEEADRNFDGVISRFEYDDTLR